MKVTLPLFSYPRKEYHERYVQYLIKIFRYGGGIVSLNGIDYDGRFIFEVNGKKAYMDYSDHPSINPKRDESIPYFKFHCHEKYLALPNIHPFSPTSFYEWERFRRLEKQIKYTAKGYKIINKQKPYGNATIRRREVRSILKRKYANNVEIKPDSEQVIFWKDINDCLVSVFVPGAYNFMLDRGHIQYMAFGCCTISPFLKDVLPYNRNIIPNIHYIQCRDDYSDLINIIEWCKHNRQTCIDIGADAKKLFDQTSRPSVLVKWVLKCLK